MTTLHRLYYRWHGGDGVWTGWLLGPGSESEDWLLDRIPEFEAQFPGCEFEWVIEPEGQKPERKGGIPKHWLPRASWWWERQR